MVEKLCSLACVLAYLLPLGVLFLFAIIWQLLSWVVKLIIFLIAIVWQLLVWAFYGLLFFAQEVRRSCRKPQKVKEGRHYD